MKKKNKNIIITRYGESTDQENNEFYLQYYQKNQIIDFLRVVAGIVIVFFLFIVNTDIGFGFFAVATGAFVIAFRDFIISMVAFFFVTPQYPIGITIKVDGVQGQIVFIRMLSVGILGKDSRGENTGELFIVPNNKFITGTVEKEDLRSGSIIREEVMIPYSVATFSVPFEEFLADLRAFLKETFPVKNTNNVGNYLSYIGHRYKIAFSFHEDKYLAITVRFVGKAAENAMKKEKIVTFASKYMVADTRTKE